MQIGTKTVESLRHETSTAQNYEPLPFPRRNQTRDKKKPRESKIDLLSASVIVGLTAQFVTFIFGLVTEFVPRLFDNILLSVFVGLCVGVIAFALMTGNDE